MKGPDLSGRSILVTGGASGIGRALAFRAAEAGAAVTVCDINDAQGEKVAEDISVQGARAQYVRLDVVEEAQHHAAVAQAIKAYGKLDGACNAAGMSFQGRAMHEIDPEFWEKVYALNLRNVFFATRAQVPAMLEAGGGSIVNIASTAGIAAIPNGADYCAAKGGVVAATRAAAIDYAKRGIRVNAILPGATRTPMLEEKLRESEGMEEWVVANNPMGRLGTADEIAYAIRWLLSDEASFVTGHIMPVDGGLTAA